MYVPQIFRQEDERQLFELIRRHPLATFIVSGGDAPIVNHLPLHLSVDAGGAAVLRGHVPRANPVWQAFDRSEAIAVFHGPQAYVSPNWYPSKAEHGKVVPTWNYAVVHVRGVPHAIEDEVWLREHLDALTAQQEQAHATPWQVADAPEDFVARMLGALVGVELPVTSVLGKWKVSQNRTEADRTGVVAGLGATASDMASMVAGSNGS